MAKVKPKEWARKSAEERARLEAAAEAPKAAPAKKSDIDADRLAEIRRDAHSGRNWAREADVGAACICGAGMRTFAAASAMMGAHGRPTGTCARHPGGTIHRNPLGTSYPGENGAS